jgi:hypothetical protein
VIVSSVTMRLRCYGMGLMVAPTCEPVCTYTPWIDELSRTGGVDDSGNNVLLKIL